MNAVMERIPMAKRMGRPKRSERNDATAKVDAEILARAKIVASDRKVPLAEYLSDLLRGLVDRDFAIVVRKLDPEKKKGS